ncbi:MAG TPA: hypothetical protein VMB80_01625 [Candidatus Acidoferrum sp.]|nr:hypothetical protein [Candidatus Acidoferrum sp.]
MKTLPTTLIPAAATSANIGTAKADSRKLAKADEASRFEAKLETEPRKSDLVVLWLFIAVVVMLTAVAGFLLWKKITLTT